MLCLNRNLLQMHMQQDQNNMSMLLMFLCASLVNPDSSFNAKLGFVLVQLLVNLGFVGHFIHLH